MKLMVLNGPNLNLLGSREPQVYGHTTLDQIMQDLIAEAAPFDCLIDPYQSNHEGALIDKVQQAKQEEFSGIIINPGGC